MAKRRPSWRDDPREAARRRELRSKFGLSVVGHAAVLAALAFSPAPSARTLPPVISVELLSMLPERPASPAPAPARPKPKKIILPVQPSAAPEKPVRVARKRRPRPVELDYQDALSKLRGELGEQSPQAPVEPPPEESAEPGSAAGVLVSAELRDWLLAAERHIRSTFITPPEFLNRGLRTCMEVFLAADGSVLGEPVIGSASGDPFWDDNAVRAVARASPLPAPPEAGDWTVCFRSEERSR